MNLNQFGEIRIFRPSTDVEDRIRQDARKHLLSTFFPGEYKGAKAVNEIVQHLFQFYQKRLIPLVGMLSCRDTVDFLLSQYDEASRILYGNGIADQKKREIWQLTEPNFRRAIKYLVELLCMNSIATRQNDPGPHTIQALEVALVCAECMAHLAYESDLAHSVFPEDCLVLVSDQHPLHCKISIGGNHKGFDRLFQARVIRDRQSRGRHMANPQFDCDPSKHAQFLDESFRQSFGMTFRDFLQAIGAVIEEVSPAEGGPSSLFVHRDTVINALAESGKPRQAIERALCGFSITAEKLLEENRVIWKPKQEYRAYRRGFYVFAHPTGQHLAFSREMAKESLIQLLIWATHNHLPPEWQTASTNLALTTLAQASGKWFEKLVCEKLTSLDFQGKTVNRTIGDGHSRIQIPDAVGEIDFLGYNSRHRMLVVIEAKMVQTGLEACYWRDDLHEFVFRSGSYADHFRKKLAWVRENAAAIALSLGYGPVSTLGAAMLTMYPCIARDFIPDFPCVSLTEFMLDYDQVSGWPYQTEGLVQ